jgi:predicted ATPase
MKIKKLWYYDDEYKWKLESVDFLANLNLLVGISGAGKTRILRAIRNLRSIANGASLNGVAWNVCFLTDDGREYFWKGKFETKENVIPIDSDSMDSEEKVKIIDEEFD